VNRRRLARENENTIREKDCFVNVVRHQQR